MRTLQHPSIQDHLKCQDAVKKVIIQLENGEDKSADRDQKAASLWTVKLNRKKRLFIAEVDSVRYLLLIDELHNYNKSLPIALRRLQKIIVSNSQDPDKLYSAYEINPGVSLEMSNAKPEALEQIDIRILRKQVFQLSREQEDLIYCTGSFIAYGVPGSGKTSSALYLIEQLIDRAVADSKPILFLAQSAELVSRMQEDWKILPASKQPNKPTVKFQTVEAFIKQQLGLTEEDETTEFVGYEVFEKFFEEQKNIILSKNKMFSFETDIAKACKIPVGVKERDHEKFICQALYQEFCLLAAKNKSGSREEANYINHNHSYFTIENNIGLQQKLLSLLNRYRDYLLQQKSKRYIDPAISLLPIADIENKPNSTIILDEAQNVPLNILEVIARSADENCAFMDDDQNTQAAKSSILHKQTLLEEIMQKEIPAYSLRQSFRCSQAVNHIARTALIIRDQLAGISTQAAAQQSEHTAEGTAKLYITSPKQPEPIENITIQLNSYKPTERLVIIQHQKAADEKQCEQDRLDKAIAQELFPDTIICFPEEIPGLEFDIVVLYHPFGANSHYHYYDNFFHANQALKIYQQQQHGKTPKSSNVPQSIKHATLVEDYRFSKFFQELYMMTTRARDAVIIIQNKFENINEAILDQWSAAFEQNIQRADVKAGSSTSEVEISSADIFDTDKISTTSSETEWLERITAMSAVKNADQEQIRDLVIQHLYQDITDNEQRYQKFLQLKAPVVDDTKIAYSSTGASKTVAASEGIAQQDDLDRIIQKLLLDKHFNTGKRNWTRCLTPEEKLFLLNPDKIYLLAEKIISNKSAILVLKKIFTFHQELITPFVNKIESMTALKMMLTEFLEAPQAKNNESYFFQLCVATQLKFLTILANAYQALKSKDNPMTSAGKAIEEIPSFIFKGLNEKPNTVNSEVVLTQLHHKKNHPVLLQLIRSGLLDFSDNKALMQYLKSWKADEKNNQSFYLCELLQTQDGINFIEEITAFNSNLVERIFFKGSINYFLDNYSSYPFFIYQFIARLHEYSIILPILNGLGLEDQREVQLFQVILQNISLRIARAKEAAIQEDTGPFFIKLVTLLNKKHQPLPLMTEECFAFSRMVFVNTLLSPTDFIETLVSFTNKVVDQIDPRRTNEAALFLAVQLINYFENYPVEGSQLVAESTLQFFISLTIYFDQREWNVSVINFPWERLTALLDKSPLLLSSNSFYSYLHNKVARAINKLTDALILLCQSGDEEFFLRICDIAQQLTKIKLDFRMSISPNEDDLFLKLSRLREKNSYPNNSSLQKINEHQATLKEISLPFLRNLSSNNFLALTKIEGKYLLQDHLNSHCKLYVIVSLYSFKDKPEESQCLFSLFDNSKESQLALVKKSWNEACITIVTHAQTKGPYEFAALIESLDDEFKLMAKIIRQQFSIADSDSNTSNLAGNSSSFQYRPSLNVLKSNETCSDIDVNYATIR